MLTDQSLDLSYSMTNTIIVSQYFLWNKASQWVLWALTGLYGSLEEGNGEKIYIIML